MLGHVQQCEDLEDGDSLRHLYHIIRGAVMLNDANLLDLLLAEENVMDVVSAMSLPPTPCCGAALENRLEMFRVATARTVLCEAGLLACLCGHVLAHACSKWFRMGRPGMCCQAQLLSWRRLKQPSSEDCCDARWGRWSTIQSWSSSSTTGTS